MNELDKKMRYFSKEYAMSAIIRFLLFIRNTLAAFFVLGGALYLLSEISPWTYKFLTDWANQPKLIDAISCELKNIVDEDLKKLPSGIDLSKIQVKFKIDRKSNARGSYIVYTQNSSIGKITEGSTKSFGEIKGDGYVVVFDKVILSDEIIVYAYYNKERIVLDSKEYDAKDCPLKLEFFGE